MTTNIDKFRTAPAPLANKCVIGLDRDGVINEDLGRYVTRPEEFVPIAGSIEAITRLRAKGYKVVVISDQAGISKGQMTEQDVDYVHQYMLDLLGKAGCTNIHGIYYSSGTDKRDPFVKPNVGMFKRCEEHNRSIKFNEGFYVGDRISDLKAALKIGARPVLVRTGKGIETEKELNKYAYKELKEKTYVFDSLEDFESNLE